MIHSPFPAELRTAAIIPRWSVVWTLNRDVVSSHSYFVTFYSYQIAKLIGWQGSYARLMYMALVHDLDETITGDLVSPTKRAIIDLSRAATYIDEKMRERLPTVVETLDSFKDHGGEDADAKSIVTAADRLDALLFLTVEQRMGNRHVFSRCQDARERLREAWMALPVDENDIHARGDDYLEHLWKSVVEPAIAEHESGGGSGV